MSSCVGAGTSVTAVFTVADVLLSSFDSAIVLSGSTLAVFVSDPLAGAVTFSLIVAFWPAVTAPPVHVTVVGPGAGADGGAHAKRLVGSTETSATPVGSV